MRVPSGIPLGKGGYLKVGGVNVNADRCDGRVHLGSRNSFLKGGGCRPFFRGQCARPAARQCGHIKRQHKVEIIFNVAAGKCHRHLSVCRQQTAGVIKVGFGQVFVDLKCGHFPRA